MMPWWRRRLAVEEVVSVDAKVRILYVGGELIEQHVAHWPNVPRRPVAEMHVLEPATNRWITLPTAGLYAVQQQRGDSPRTSPLLAWAVSWRDGRLQGYRWTIFQGALHAPTQREEIDLPESALGTDLPPLDQWLVGAAR
jgi:hypothetical protein